MIRPGWTRRWRVAEWALLILGFATFWRGVDYGANGVPSGSIPPVEAISWLVPIAVWTTLWIVAGVAALLGLWWRRLFAIGASSAAVMWLVWAGAFCVATFEGKDAAFLTSLAWLSISVAIYALAQIVLDNDEELRG